MDINQVLQNNRAEVGFVLRRHRVLGQPTLETIKKGYEQKGDKFMIDIMSVITPKTSNLTLLEPKTATVSNAQSLAVSASTKTLDPMNTASQSTGGFWKFWDNLLTNVAKTGETIGQFKTDAQSQAAGQVYTNQDTQQMTQNRNVLYWIAGGLVALILVVLILKK